MVFPKRFVVGLMHKCLAVLVLAFGALDAFGAGDGEKMYNELREKSGLYPDEEWQTYVTEIGERLLAASPHAGHHYTFTVIDNPVVNAQATQDGYIFVNRGVIAYLRSEDELAGIIGHEIGHVVGRHVQKRKGANRLGNILGWIGALGTSTMAIKDLGNTITTAAITREAREQELEADAYGSEFLAKAGYDPLAMINAIYVLKEHEMFSKSVMNQPNVYHGLFGTHPRNDKRLHDIVGKAVPLQTYETRGPERDFWEMMDGLVFGSESATGLIKDGVYYHGTLRIVVKFPEGWDVTNTPTEIIGRDIGTTSTGSITVQRQKPPESEQTPEQYVTETLKRDDVDNGETLTVHGYAAYIADIEVFDGTAQSKKIAIIYKDGGVYLFRGNLGKVGDVEQFEKDFRGTIESFRAMTARDLQIANDQRIRVVIAKPGDTYAEYAKRVSIKTFPEETLRFINGHHPRGEPRDVDMIKIVE